MFKINNKQDKLKKVKIKKRTEWIGFLENTTIQEQMSENEAKK